MNILEFLAQRRDNRVHSVADIQAFVQGATRGDIPDYQVAAWLMAAYLNPLDAAQTAALTLAMADSGDRLDLSSLPKPWVDKHSTGGVGDKTTLVTLPLLAACGLTVVKMSGRGLGITGGTVDKLESVPGFRMDLTPEEMIAQAGRIGLAVTGQTPRLAPADKLFYGLRDVTSTVPSIPLIASSILSKKIAGGAETVVLDVKCGSGAFMNDLAQAKELARWLRDIGTECGLRVEAEITDMDQPLGQACGNTLEVLEAIHTLQDRGPARFTELCLHVTGVALHACGAEPTLEKGIAKATEKLKSGAAFRKAQQWFEAQGADPKVLEDDSWAVRAPIQLELNATSAGFVQQMDARAIGQAVVDLGGGRQTKEDTIDHRVGVVCHAEVGDSVSTGQQLLTLHAGSAEDAERVVAHLQGAVTVTEERVEKRPLVLG